jgi:hypothetical protein
MRKVAGKWPPARKGHRGNQTIENDFFGNRISGKNEPQPQSARPYHEFQRAEIRQQ